MTNKDITIIETNIKSQLLNKSTSPLFIAGSPGSGKSSAISVIAKNLDMNLLDVSAPSITIEVLNGLPDEYKATKYNKYSVIDEDVNATKWSIPEIMANTMDLAEEKDTILLLDDFHMVAPHLQAYFYKLLLQRMLGNYKLPDNVVILGTMNTSTEAGFGGINSAVRNRMSILEVEFNFDWWFDSFGKNLDYRVASYLRAKPKGIMEEESTSVEGYATARAWTAIATELPMYPNDFVLHNADTIAGMQMSKERAKDFHSHVAYIDAIDFNKMVKDKDVKDMSTMSTIDIMTYPYVVNFISTIADGVYLMDLIEANKDEEAFVAFVLGNLYSQYTSNGDELSDGVRVVIDILLGNKADVKLYSKATKAQLTKAFKYKFTNADELMSKVSRYII